MPDKQFLSSPCMAEIYTDSSQVLNLAVAGTYYYLGGYFGG